jgi:hypothetical protein
MLKHFLQQLNLTLKDAFGIQTPKVCFSTLGNIFVLENFL